MDKLKKITKPKHMNNSKEPSITQLAVRLNIRPEQEELFLEAITHSSFGHEHSTQNNERLEFLGDSVLGLIVCRFLFDSFASSNEGVLAKIKSTIVSAPVLAGFTKQLELEKFLRLGQGELKTCGKSKQNILADLFEAVIGAYFINFGLEKTTEFVLPLVKKVLPQIMDRLDEINAKTNLQEITQAKGYQPEYHLVKEEGPPHDKTFKVEVCLNNVNLGSGSGKTIKEAQNKAAANALSKPENKIYLD